MKLSGPIISLLAAARVFAGDIVTPHGVINLFTPSNAAAWSTWLIDSKQVDPRHVFAVDRDQIRISGDGLGYVGTRDEYRNYKLSLEFRWGAKNTRWGDRVGKARDSGVFLHASGPDGNSHDGNGAFMAAIECNVFQGATGDFLLIRGNDRDGKLIAPAVTVETTATRDSEGWPWWQPGGARTTMQRWGRVNWRYKSLNWRDELNFRAARDVEKSYGEWNRLEITCEAEHISIVLNDVRVNEAFAVWPNHGRILLQCEGSEIFYRRVQLSPVRSQ